MQVPSIHLNGTSAEELMEQCCEAAAALNRALSALSAAAPNGRDYYTQGSQAFELARRDHEERTAKVRAVMLEMQELSEKIDAADYARRTRRAVGRMMARSGDRVPC